MKYTGRRVVRVELSAEVIHDVCKVGVLSHNDRFVEIIEGVPSDSKLVGIDCDYAALRFEMFVEHPSFDVVTDSDNVPHISVIVRNNMLPRDVPA